MTFLANPKLILMRNNMIARQDDLPNANYEYPSNPAVTTNPTKINMSWLNTLTGETFVCTDNTTNTNVWVGNLGSYVGPNEATAYYNYLADALPTPDYGPADYTGTAVDTGIQYDAHNFIMLFQLYGDPTGLPLQGLISSYYGTSTFEQFGLRINATQLNWFQDDGGAFGGGYFNHNLGVNELATYLVQQNLDGGNISCWKNGVLLQRSHAAGQEGCTMSGGMWVGRDGDNPTVPNCSLDILGVRLYQEEYLEDYVNPTVSF